MKTKILYAGIIAALFIAAMIVFNKTMTLGEIILAFIGAGSTIGWVWKWINEKEILAQLKAEQTINESLEYENRQIKKKLIKNNK
jgi:hypothetical protein